jgi:Family of unknown function (DUF6152)
MDKRFVPAMVAGACLVLSVAAGAHHGAASFDNEKRLTLKGTVTEWLWANPHCFLKVDVKDESGTVRNWNLELGNPTDSTTAGYRRTTFKGGEDVTVTVIPVKSGAPVGRLVTVILPDGQKLPQ